MTKLDVCPRLPAPLPVETFLSGPSSVLQPPSAPASKPVAMLAGAGAQGGATGTRTLGRDPGTLTGRRQGKLDREGALCWEGDVAAESVEDVTCPTHQRRNPKQVSLACKASDYF